MLPNLPLPVSASAFTVTVQVKMFVLSGPAEKNYCDLVILAKTPWLLIHFSEMVKTLMKTTNVGTLDLNPDSDVLFKIEQVFEQGFCNDKLSSYVAAQMNIGLRSQQLLQTLRAVAHQAGINIYLCD